MLGDSLFESTFSSLSLSIFRNFVVGFPRCCGLMRGLGFKLTFGLGPLLLFGPPGLVFCRLSGRECGSDVAPLAASDERQVCAALLCELCECLRTDARLDGHCVARS